MRAVVAFAIFAAFASAQDAAAILAKAHAAYVENRQRDRFWTWTTVYRRSVLRADDSVGDTLPTVTVDSPRRRDGRRCNAVIAWGDGTEPYLANATADERCAAVTEEASLFRIDALLARKHASIHSRNPDEIVLELSEDRAALKTTDPIERCVASINAMIHVDAATFFPTFVQADIPGTACEVKKKTAANHYDDEIVKNVTVGYSKDTTLDFRYELQKDRVGNASKDFWICTRRQIIRPLEHESGGLIVYGRKFSLMSRGPNRRVSIDGETSAQELSTESDVKFVIEKPQ